MSKRAQNRGPSLKLPEIPEGNIREAVTAAGGRGKTMHYLPIENIKVLPGLNIRLTQQPGYEENIARLTHSIMRNGFYETSPLGCMASVDAEGNSVIYVIHGHQRLEAAKRAVAAGWDKTELPCIITANEDPSDLAVSMEQQNITRALTSLEQGIIAKRLTNAKMTQEEIADRLGLKPRQVRNLLTLVNGPKEIIELVKTGALKATAALTLIRDHADDPEEGIQQAVKMATRPDTDESGEPKVKVKMTTEKISFSGEEGSEVTREEVERFMPFFSDEDWFKPTRSKKRVMLTEAVSVEIKVRRPAKLTEEEAVEEEATDVGEADAAVEEKATRKRGRSRADAAPDLVAEGIVEPVDTDPL